LVKGTAVNVMTSQIHLETACHHNMLTCKWVGQESVSKYDVN